MLKLKILTFEFFRFFQSGFDLDFFFKKIVEILLKNFFIYTSLFFGEKFIIEFLTKKAVDNLIFNLNYFFNFLELIYSKFFIFLIILIFFF